MEAAFPIGILLCVGGGLLVTLLVGLAILIKLGVFVSYAARKEEPDRGEYGLDDSHEVNE